MNINNRGSSLQISLEFRHLNEKTVEELLAEGGASLKKDLSRPLQELKNHWVDTVGDLRLLAQEDQLRFIGLPLLLLRWLEEEITKIGGIKGLPSEIDTKEVEMAVVTSPVAVMAAASAIEQESFKSLVFSYESDFDTNGILYYLGTSGKTKEWENPAELKLVRILTTGMLENSFPESAIVGRSVVRCVTQSHDSAHFIVDFNDRYIKPTHYTLRHYDSWDTECLRDWNLEASNDLQNWFVLLEHKNDQNLNSKGASFTWTIPPIPPQRGGLGGFFRAFKVRMTGPNSNKHLYMACSGFEMYGEMIETPLEGPSDMGISKAAEPLVDAKLDTNGVLYAIGTYGGQRPFTNPAESGLVVITASSVMPDSANINALSGRELVRCVTKSLPNAWVQIDFLEKTVQATHYMLRHYATWDTEALRNWRFEGSNDGYTWSLLSEHLNDQSLQAKGQVVIWPLTKLEAQRAYRLFRVLQTGENSNGHLYLALSGIELYGKLCGSDGITPYIFPVIKPVLPLYSLSKEFKVDGPGIVYYLGTNFGAESWRNPASRGLLNVTASSLSSDSQPAWSVVGQEVVRCVTKSEPNSWFIIDFVERQVQPTHYSLRHYASWDVEALRYWQFQGSNDGTSWTTLRDHVNDQGLDRKGAIFTWPLPGVMQAYRMFRVLLTGLNSNNHYYLALSGFELYGTLYGPQSPINLVPSAPPSISAPFPPLSLQGPLPPLSLTNPILPVPPGSVSSLPPIQIPALPPAFVPAPVAVSPPFPLFAPSTPLASSGDKKVFPLTWDKEFKGPFMQVEGKSATNLGSENKWQLVRSAQAIESGKNYVAIRIDADPQTSNTWRFILGVVPSTFDASAAQWVGSKGSWGYIAGTGGKCHQKAQSLTYGAKFQGGDVVGMCIDLDMKTVEFYLNGVPQGVAYDNVIGPVYIAVSSTATNASFSFTEWLANRPLTWDPVHKSKYLEIDSKTGDVINIGSQDKWQSIRSSQSFDNGVLNFAIEVVESPDTPNSWRMIVGIVPESFQCSGQKQWVGASGSWGYIAGTGGRCSNQPQSLAYGEVWGKKGDVIGVRVSFIDGTLEFLKNGVSQGIAFNDIKGAVYPAVSLTATNSRIRLISKK